MKKAARQQAAAEEVRRGLPRNDPVKEIIREFHQTMVPTPVPAAPPRDDKPLIDLLQQAMARNQDLGLVAQQMGCLLYTSPSPRDGLLSRMPSSA